MTARESAIDHLVLATDDVAATSAWLADTTGVTPSAGGSHVGVGTRNELCALGGGMYLEIIGPDPAQGEVSGPRPFGLDELKTWGMARWCVRHGDLTRLQREAAGAGMAYSGPLAMQRQAPEQLLSWELLLPDFDTAGGIVPLFIDWGHTTHPSGSAAQGLELVSIVGTHPSPEDISDKLGALGVSLEVRHAPTAALVVKIAGPLGEITLPSATFKTATDSTLSEFRERIDQLDDQLVRLLAERFDITKAVGAYKATAGLPPADPAREAEQTARLREVAQEVGMDPAFSEKVFRLIVDEVIRHHVRLAENNGSASGETTHDT